MIEPAFNADTKTITIPKVIGANHYINGAPVRGDVVISEDTSVVCKPNPGSVIRPETQTVWHYHILEEDQAEAEDPDDEKDEEEDSED